MKVIIESSLSDYIESKLTKAYEKGGKYLQQGALFRRRLYGILKEFEESDLSECSVNPDGSLSYTPPDGYLCTMTFIIGYDAETNTRILILNSLDWKLDEWIFEYFLEVLSESNNKVGEIISETINEHIHRILRENRDAKIRRIVRESIDRYINDIVA